MLAGTLWEKPPAVCGSLPRFHCGLKCTCSISHRCTKTCSPVLSLSPDQGYNRALPQFLRFLFLSNKIGGLASVSTLSGWAADFVSDCLVPAHGEVLLCRWAFFPSLFFISPGLPLFGAYLSLLLSPLVKSNCYCKPPVCPVSFAFMVKPTKHSFQ